MLRLIPIVIVLLLQTAATNAQPAAGESHFARLDDLKIHYTIYGKAEPTLVFVHGWACDETVWNAQAPELAQKLRCITVDLPGHGQSDKPEIRYTMHLYARALDAVMRDAQVRSAVLVGHSNGVPVIRQFYREVPESVRGLVIVDGTLRPFADAATIQKFLGPFRGPDYAQTVSKFVEGLTKTIPNEALRERIKTLILRTPQQVSVRELESTTDPEIWKPDKIEVPVLMILAKQPAWTPEYEQFARGLVPKLDYQMWENVSHFIMMEKPREFNDALRTWLKSSGLAGMPSKN